MVIQKQDAGAISNQTGFGKQYNKSVKNLVDFSNFKTMILSKGKLPEF